MVGGAELEASRADSKMVVNNREQMRLPGVVGGGAEGRTRGRKGQGGG